MKRRVLFTETVKHAAWHRCDRGPPVAVQRLLTEAPERPASVGPDRLPIPEVTVRFQALMVRRIGATDTDAVAKIFAEHDATGLPARLGVAQRTLFQYHGLYFHLVQSDVDFLPKLYDARNDDLIKDVDAKLRGHLRPYLVDQPAMAQSQATPFYQWHAGS